MGTLIWKKKNDLCNYKRYFILIRITSYLLYRKFVSFIVSFGRKPNEYIINKNHKRFWFYNSRINTVKLTYWNEDDVDLNEIDIQAVYRAHIKLLKHVKHM